MSIFRLTGPVAEVGERRGIAKGSGEPYAIPFAVVSLGDFVHETVNLSDQLVGTITTGDLVDLMVEVTYSGGYMRARAMRSWPVDFGGDRQVAKPASPARPLAAATSS